QGNAKHPSVILFAGWLAHRLGVNIRVQHEEDSVAITGATLLQETGAASLRRPQGSTTLTTSTPQADDQQVSLPMRTLSECLVEDLRRLDPDETYAAALAATFDVELL